MSRSAEPPRRETSESKTTVAVAFSANLLIAIAKLVGGLLSRPFATLAEAGHSFAHAVNQGVPWAPRRSVRDRLTRIIPSVMDRSGSSGRSSLRRSSSSPVWSSRGGAAPGFLRSWR